MTVKTNIRLLLVFAFDLLMVVVAWLGGFFIRFNFTWPYSYNTEVIYGLLLLLCAQVVACRWAGLYRGMWRFASLSDLKRVLKAVAVSTFVLLVVMLFAKPHLHIPRSLVVLYPILLLLLMSGGRVAWRMWKEYSLYGRLDGQGKPVVIV